MAKVSYKTEDQVRDGAKIILGFDKSEAKIQQGTGQITTFNQLGFKGVIDKPDGWYLPDDLNSPAIILETKSQSEDISLQKWANELIKNCNIVLTKYKQVVGILYNGTDIRVFLNNSELHDAAPTLQDKAYYLSLFTKNAIDNFTVSNTQMTEASEIYCYNAPSGRYYTNKKVDADGWELEKTVKDIYTAAKNGYYPHPVYYG